MKTKKTPTPATKQDYMDNIMMNLRVEPNGLKVGYVPLNMVMLPEYQRRDESHVLKIAEHFDARLCGYVKLSQQGDHFNVIDGGHRCRAAVYAGNSHILAMVYTGMDVKQEANLFAHQNDNLTVLTPYDKFNAAVVSGADYETGRSALALKACCDRHNVKIKKHALPTSTGVLRSLSTAWRIAGVNPTALEWMFNMIEAVGWNTEPGAYGECFIISLYQIYQRHETDLHDTTIKLCSAMRNVSPKVFEVNSRAAFIDRGPAPAVTAMMESMIRGDDKIEVEA